ncbi:Interferon regulatory factor 8 [Merluccius polli]|uniref:Interferon regulatory factor 8 n=1 Tax=Merluccius polli TaxID=89951 RepID=A0AA47M7L1_MERPO|nr:Interferon regulatory factor 8 [Merluccius polli]
MSSTGGRRLKQWLIEQIQSGHYSGLQWEDGGHTMFRIPWKHAGKQDYNQEVDASIFKAWAVFKGKFKEGDKAEPATWKTRLRCALNKSPDFEEVTDRSQLDISEPYKVYRIVPEEEQKLGKSAAMVMTAGEITDLDCSPAEIEELIKEASSEDYPCAVKRSHSPQEDGCSIQASPEYWSHSSITTFSQMMISFYYGGQLMHSTLISHPEGCRIAPAPLQQRQLVRSYSSDALQNVHFPPAELIEHERQRHVTCKLLGHLERGVLVRANREGIFIKRLCQSRVFWSALGEPRPHHGAAACKLERDAVVKIFDTGRFLQAIQLHQEGQFPAPDPTVMLCFGEELHDLTTAKNKLILVQITAMNCQQLVEAVNMRRVQSYNHSPSVEMSDEMASDQMARIYQDLCSYSAPQRTDCYRDNVPITA